MAVVQGKVLGQNLVWNHVTYTMVWVNEDTPEPQVTTFDTDADAKFNRDFPEAKYSVYVCKKGEVPDPRAANWHACPCRYVALPDGGDTQFRYNRCHKVDPTECGDVCRSECTCE